LRLRDVPLGDPGPGEIRVAQAAIGINFVDIYHRCGLYALPALPAVLGVEAAGTVVALGSEVEGLRIGDRVAYAGAVGAYAAERLLPAWRAIPVPVALDDAHAATALARGITCQMLVTRVYPVAAGSLVLVHAAAGGVGSLLVRWAKRRGARVIGTVGSDAKAEAARAAGVDELIVGRNADFGRTVAALSDGRGVDVAYDGIGGTTLLKTIDCVRPFGTVVSMGQAGGPIPPLDVEELGPRRSLSLARPSVMRYMTDPATYRTAAAEVFAALAEGLAQLPGEAYPLAEAGRGQAALEGGKTTGCSYLLP
jgi:NADPH2:quinone reductase